MRRLVASLALAGACVFRAAGDDLSVARSALRDGLWDIARAHASAVDGDDGRLMELESLASEGKWQDLLTAADGAGEGDGVRYYRAAACYRLGDRTAARAELAKAAFADVRFVSAARRLEALLLMEDGRTAEALALFPERVDEVGEKMLVAELRLRRGERKLAEGLWREVLAVSNVDERVAVAAAAQLDDAAALRRLFDGARFAESRLQAGLALGRLLVKSPATAAEGERIVRAAARTSPDASGMKPAFLALADAALGRQDFATATAVYADALEMWPDLAQNAVVQEGRGWALEGQGRLQEALEAFRQAVLLSTNDSERALAKVKIGDVLSRDGKLDAAMAEYRSVLADYPDTLAAARIADVIRIRELEAQGRTEFENYRFAEAQRHFAEVAEKDASRREKMAFYDVMCLYGQGRDADAEDKVRQLVATAADVQVRAEAALWLAKFSYNRGKWKESAALFADYARQSPKSAFAASARLWSARSFFAAGDFDMAIQSATALVEACPDAPEAEKALLVQGEALIELARFDEALLVLERASVSPTATAADRLDAQLLRADALLAMGADDPARYLEALEAFRALRLGETLSASGKIVVSYKLAKTLEKLKRFDEAAEEYYTQVLLAYRDGRTAGVRYDDEARAAFSRSAFRLAEEYESRGKMPQALSILELVANSDVPAAAEAVRRRDRLQRKGDFL